MIDKWYAWQDSCWVTFYCYSTRLQPSCSLQGTFGDWCDTLGTLLWEAVQTAAQHHCICLLAQQLGTVEHKNPEETGNLLWKINLSMNSINSVHEKGSEN